MGSVEVERVVSALSDDVMWVWHKQSQPYMYSYQVSMAEIYDMFQ